MIDKRPLRQVLDELGFAADLPEAVLDELATAAALIDYPAGATIFHEGNENHFLYFVHTGHVGLDMHVPGRGRVRILTLGPGEMLAWSALVGDGRMTVSAIAIDDTQVVAAAAQKLSDICRNNHQVGYELMARMAQALAQRLTATRLQLLDLFADRGAGFQGVI
jgi:CRP-like cAMP-binding protein